MTQATNSRKQVAFVPEVTFGVTPTTPDMQVIEFVDFKGSLNTPLLQDNSVRADRQVADARRGNESANVELEVVDCLSNVDWAIEAVLQGTWASNVVKVGTVQRSYSMEEGFLDLGKYHVFKGVTFDTMSIEVSTDKLVTMKFSAMGATESAFTGTPLDATPTPVTSHPKLYHVGGTFKEGGVAIGYLSSIQLELKNNLQASNVLGTSGVRAITSGQAMVTGKATALFENETLYNKFINNVDSSLEFTFADGVGTQDWLVPKIKITKAAITGSGFGPLTVEVEFTSIVDSVTGTTLQVTRS